MMYIIQYYGIEIHTIYQKYGLTAQIVKGDKLKQLLKI